MSMVYHVHIFKRMSWRVTSGQYVRPFQIENFRLYPINSNYHVKTCRLSQLFNEHEGYHFCHKYCKSGTHIRLGLLLLHVSLHSVNCKLCRNCIFYDFANFIIIEKNHLKICNNRPITCHRKLVWQLPAQMISGLNLTFPTCWFSCSIHILTI